MSEDYVVRFGNEHGVLGRTDYMSKKQSLKFYDSLLLELNSGAKYTWKELLYEPLDECEAQYIVKEEESKVVVVSGVRVVVPMRINS